LLFFLLFFFRKSDFKINIKDPKLVSNDYNYEPMGVVFLLDFSILVIVVVVGGGQLKEVGV
jgi:hypothetical protein